MNPIFVGISGAVIGVIIGFIVGVYRSNILRTIKIILRSFKILISHWFFLLAAFGIVYSFIFHTDNAIGISLFIIAVMFLVFLSNFISMRGNLSEEVAGCFVFGSVFNIFMIYSIVLSLIDITYKISIISALFSIIIMLIIQLVVYRKSKINS